MLPMTESVQNAKEYLEGYAYGVYPRTFAAYVERFSPQITRSVQASGSIPQLAEQILDELAELLKKEGFLRRSRLRGDQKLMLTVYLTPLLLASPEVKCQELARTLCARWRERYPKDAYHPADYERIAAGFHRKILGFTIEEKPKEIE